MTLPHPAPKRGLLTQIWRATIWAKGAIRADERKYATPLERFMLPMFNATMIVAGLFAVHSGIPSIEQLMPGAASDGFGYGFVLVALAALVGVVFPCLHRVELAAKILMFSLLGLYLVCLRVLAADDTGSRDFISVIVFASMLTPALRLWILGTEIRDRRA